MTAGSRAHAAVRQRMHAAVVVSMVWLAATAPGAVSQGILPTTPRDEILPAADAWLMWSQNSAAHPHRYTEYAESNPASSGGPCCRMRVNAVGT